MVSYIKTIPFLFLTIFVLSPILYIKHCSLLALLVFLLDCSSRLTQHLKSSRLEWQINQTNSRTDLEDDYTHLLLGVDRTDTLA